MYSISWANPTTFCKAQQKVFEYGQKGVRDSNWKEFPNLESQMQLNGSLLGAIFEGFENPMTFYTAG